MKNKLGKNFGKELTRKKFLPLQRSREKNPFNFLYFGCATQNRALDMMKFVSKIFFFIKGIYGVCFKRIDNGPKFTTISTIVAREIFKKICKLS